MADAPLPALRERIGKAVAHLSAALARDPRHADAWYLRGKARLMASRPDDALPDLDRAVELAPTNPSFALARAQARMARMDEEPAQREGARRDFEAVARLTRDEGDRRLALAHLALLEGRAGDAYAHAESALGGEPDRWELHALRARCAPDPGEREKSARAAVRLRPNDAGLRRQASDVIEPRSPAEALPFLRESLRLRDDPSSREALVRVLRKLGRSREAAAEAESLVGQAPEMGRYQRSQVRLFLGDPEGAISDLEACLRLRDTWDYWGDLASARLAAGRPAEAVDALRRAFALNATGDRQLDATLVRLCRAHPPALGLAREVEASRPALAQVCLLDAALRAALEFPAEAGEILEADPLRAGLRRFALGDYEGAAGTAPATRAASLLRALAALCRGTSIAPPPPAELLDGEDAVAYAARIARGALERDGGAAALFPGRLESRLLDAYLAGVPASRLLG
ncbi:MAG TPA: tetratricopeptide repeat protein, partial [Acetobacteraceae bacterium]|nr:tetratricopeptide repeat protein [Acetobacteraceae bacterium]